MAAEKTLVVLAWSLEQNAQRLARDLGAIAQGSPTARRKREGERFISQATNRAKLEIFAESSEKFFLKVVDAQVTFSKDAAGKGTGIVLHQGGRNTESG